MTSKATHFSDLNHGAGSWLGTCFIVGENGRVRNLAILDMGRPVREGLGVGELRKGGGKDLTSRRLQIDIGLY